MKILLSVPGRFHGFHLARGLSQASNQLLVHTTYPGFESRKYLGEIPTRSHFTIEVFRRILPRALLSGEHDLTPWLSERFDRAVAREIGSSLEVFTGWSGWSRESIRKAKSAGALTFLERGNAHIIDQNEILADEHRRFNLEYAGIHPKVIEKELEEYEEADYLSLLSRSSKESFQARGFDPAKLLVTTLGVDVSRFRRVQKEDSVFRFIYCGAVSLRKGVYYLAKAFSELRLKHAELWIVGPVDSVMPDVLRTVPLDGVRFFGAQKESKLPWFYSQANAFVLPSIEDGFGMVFTQAMACGLPVIGTRNTGVPDLVTEGHDGFVVEIRDVRALKERLAYLYENSLRCQEMGKHAQETIARQGSWSDYGKRMSEKYRECLGRRLDSGAAKLAIGGQRE